MQYLSLTLQAAFRMFWEVLWPLIFGFTLSAIIQAIVSREKLSHTLGSVSVKTTTLATLLGMASSSCSYAAIAIARSLFTKGASFTSSMIFQLASTNLVIELGFILWVFLGWQFVLAEVLGGLIMIGLLFIIFRRTLSLQTEKQAKAQATKGIKGKMEGHASMNMSIEGNQPWWDKLLTSSGFTAVSHFFVMDWASIWGDIALGFLIAGAIEIFVPQSFWHAFFFTNNPTLAFIEGPLIGPLIAILSFVCSVGNIPLAAVLWSGGMSFGGVISFIFADLLVLPILNIYRKYYGWKVMLYILGTYYLTMVIAGYIVEILFSMLHIIPTNRDIMLLSMHITFNYTTILNIIFGILAIILVIRFLKTGGPEMLRMMEHGQHHTHDHHH